MRVGILGIGRESVIADRINGFTVEGYAQNRIISQLSAYSDTSSNMIDVLDLLMSYANE